ncbi:MAG: hypothetical protein ABII79_12170 [bacterium]
MMKYLNYNRFERFLARHFGSPAQIRVRMAGADRRYDSGYIDIARFYGPGALDPQEIRIKYLPDRFEFCDSSIAEYAYLMTDLLRKEGRLYDGPEAMKVVDISLDSRPYNMTVQPCSYSVQAGSCFALDYPHPLFAGQGEYLRNYYKIKYPEPGLKQNPLAVCLGICGWLLLKQGNRQYLLLVLRSDTVASLEGSVGPSAAGAVDYAPGYGHLAELAVRAMKQEVTEELNLDESEFAVTPLAYAREVFRGERPQIFCLIRSQLTPDEITDRLEAVDEQKREFNSFALVRLGDDGRLKTDDFNRLNHEARMNYLLLEEYFSIDAQ